MAPGRGAPAFKLHVYAEVDVAYVLDQLPSGAYTPTTGLPQWPQPQLSMAMVETQVWCLAGFSA